METIKKPWGYEQVWAHTEKYAGKILHIEKGKRLSLQYHAIKDETICVQSGKILLTIERDGGLVDIELEPGITIHISPKTVHRMEAIVDSDVLEVSTSELDDVVRIEDDFGR